MSANPISRPWMLVIRRLIPLCLAAIPVLIVSVFAQQTPPSQPPPHKISEANQACMDCHDPEAQGGPSVQLASLQKSPHAEHDCTDCHSSFTADAPHTAEMKAEKVQCSNCHSEEDEKLAASVHKPRKVLAADVPTCISCHSVSADPHEVVRPSERTRQSLVQMCVPCHSDKERMERNGVASDSVDTYEASFHGKALMRFGKLNTAICVDCHTNHSVLPASNAKSTINHNNLPKTCGQPNCHPGAPMNFANSGFNHLELKARKEPILAGIETFFKVLTFGVLGLLLLGIALDLRVALIGPKKGVISPIAAIFIALSFALLIASIVLAVLNEPLGLRTTVGAVLTGMIASIAHVMYKKSHPRHTNGGKRYQRFNVSQRIQHIALMLSFIILVVTGMPIRFPKNDVLRSYYLALGGIDVMRTTHRVAAVILIVAWIYHTLELLVRWKKAGFTFASWTMWPRMRDVTDFFNTIRYNLGRTPNAPSFDRFQFREKFDYFAVYWGMPIMVFSGLILWFPVYFGGLMPSLGIPIAYVAHADESVLAFLTIATWHFYNTHFHPDHFPMNPVFITGELSEEAMMEHHGDELARIKAQEGAQVPSTTIDSSVEAPPAETEKSVDPDETPETPK